MIQFILGILIGGLIGFLICAVFSINKTEKQYKDTQSTPPGTGDNNAHNDL